MSYVTIDDKTNAFVHVEDIRGAIPVDADKQEESGYKCIIFLIGRDIPSPLPIKELRQRMDAAVISVSNDCSYDFPVNVLPN